MTITEAARKMALAGLAVLPTGDRQDPGDHKAPRMMEDKRRYAWKSNRPPHTLRQIERLFGQNAEIGIICGKPSGNLECLDFDREDAWPRWVQVVEEHGGRAALGKCYREHTPGKGMHLVYRLGGEVAGNRHLAKGENGRKAIVETRGEGGYFKCWPSEGYRAVEGHLSKIGVLTDEEYELFMTAARSLNECPLRADTSAEAEAIGGRPGDDFGRRTTWQEILGPYGWKACGKTTQDRPTWTRPGKDTGPSASTGNLPSGDHLWVYSSSTEFVAGRAYSKFYAYTLLNHGGDAVAAAKYLAGHGYGESRDLSGFGHIETPLAEVARNRVIRYDGPVIRKATAVPIEKPLYVWEPYLLRSQIQIVDGRGGSRKTSLILLIAATLSRGRLPFGGVCEPVKTLLFGLEDSLGAYRSIFERAEGDSAFLELSEESFDLCKGGAEWLADACEKECYGLVVFDPFKTFLGDVRSELDTLQVTNAFNKIRPYAQKTQAAWVGISHWSKGASLLDMSKAHAGAEAWRNSSRGMLSVAKHPEQPSLSCVHHTKASIQTPEGEPFAFESRGGRMLWVPGEAVDWAPFSASAGGGGKGVLADRLTTDSRVLLVDLLKEGLYYVHEIRQKFLEKGFDPAGMYRARKGLSDVIVEGQVERPGAPPLKTWHLLGGPLGMEFDEFGV